MQNDTFEELIQRIKTEVHLEEYMQESGVDVVRKGVDSWTIRCWLHPDHTPSISLSLGKSLYYCHSTGCKNGGDILNFHERFFHVDRGQAIRDLAGRIGANVKGSTMGDKPDKVKEVMQWATEEWHIALLSTPKAMSYVQGRGVSEDVMSEFQIGYAKEPLKCPPHIDPSLFKSLELDSFKYRDALVLPCVDPTTGAVAHYVRPIKASKLKYMGPASSNPSRWVGMTFGLNVARRYANADIILVEGQFDCLTLHSYGFRNAVCTLGSHPSSEQFERIGQLYIQHATVLFDADTAGSAGALSVLKTCPRGIRISVATLPQGDPDEFVMQEGRQALQDLLGQALSPADFIIDQHKEALDGDANSISTGLDGAIAGLSALSQADYVAGISRLSKLSGVPVERLWDLTAERSEDKKATIDSERQVLAMCAQNPEYVHLLDQIPDDAWVLAKHRTQAEKLKTLTAGGVIVFTDKLLGPDSAWLFTVEPSNFEYHVAQIKEAFTRRELARVARRLAQSAGDVRERVEDVVSMHMQEVSKSAASQGGKVEFTAGEVVEGAMDYIHERMAHPDTIPGIDLGARWKNVTKATLGFQKNRLYLVGAGPKVGKTSLALNWALACAVERKVPTLWINLEMSEKDLMMRMFSIATGISALRVQAGTITLKEKQILDLKATEILSSPLHILNGFGMSVESVIASMRKYVYLHTIQLSFIDYIQLLNVQRGQNLDYWERHAMVSTALKEAINGDLGIPVVALSQLGRPAASEGSSSGSFIGGSYKYIQDCDTFMGLRVRSDKELEDGQAGNLVLNVEYNRHGPQDVYTRLYFNRDNLRIEEVE